MRLSTTKRSALKRSTVPGTSGTYYSRRPFTPRGRIISGGIQDLSNIPVRLQIFQNPGRIPVYNQVVIVPDVGADAPLNVASTDFPPFTPQVAVSMRPALLRRISGRSGSQQQSDLPDLHCAAKSCPAYSRSAQRSGDPRNYPTIKTPWMISIEGRHGFCRV
ncbi:MAG: hypothetical protein IPP80_00450 [Ignavibacteria bacterium]|nr:hypothetical protein [Ignavibacteria bacterium]